MKKIIALILAAMMLLSCAACASKTTDAAASTADPTTNTTEPADTAEEWIDRCPLNKNKNRAAGPDDRCGAVFSAR